MLSTIAKIVTAYLSFIETSIGVTGFTAKLLVSITLTVIFIFSIVVIGSLLEKLQLYFLRFIARITGKEKAALIFRNYITFPGVMIHELSHAIMCIITGAKIVDMRLFRPDKETKLLGYVKFRPQGTKTRQRVQMALTSCAPVMLGYIYELLLYRIILVCHLKWYVNFILMYLFISIFLHMTMSDLDIKNYLKGSIFLLPVILILTHWAVFGCIMQYAL